MNKSMLQKPKKPFVLVILDGWGIRKDRRGNAVAQARLPNYKSFLRKYPHTELKAAEEAVGLVKGAIGNSEVGHMNIGAGRIVYQELVRINRSIADGSFFRNPVLLEAAKKVKKAGSALHLFGLLSDGKVHSEISHLFALLRFAKKQDIVNTWIHCILDGRDVAPKSAERYLLELQREMRRIGIGKIATVIGRYYAMDRDKRWERTEKAYNAMLGIGPRFKTALGALKGYYARGITDEFVLPTVIGNFEGIKNDDVLVFFNFRSDRARQLTMAFINKRFGWFKRKLVKVHFVGMCEYDPKFHIPVICPPVIPKGILGELLSKAGLRQLRIAESEKYAHVTYFFNNGIEKPFPNEDRIIIPSPKVATYDLAPEMRTKEITDALLNELQEDIYDFAVVNFASPDMVGHTGKIDAAIRALEVVDNQLGRIVQLVLEKKGVVIITADHGNCEEMIGKRRTSHTLAPVP
ncbi:MAG: 2,3-bisphosphoglycerate-independent phosphoglycerate mutase, partial [Candidatus Woesearchaeota archaeon]